MRAEAPASGAWIVRLLLAGTVIGLVAALAVWSGWLVLLLPAVVLAWAAIATIRAARRGAAAARAFREQHPDRDVLIVYSNSPHWTSHIEREWIPRWGDRAVMVNWSDRSQWSDTAGDAAVQLFLAVAGRRAHTPIAIVVSRAGTITAVRFWRAFGENAQGRPAALDAAEARLEAVLPGR